MNSWGLYEKKVITDAELPAQLATHKDIKAGQYFPPHWHEHIEMHYILQGRGHFLLNLKRVNVEAGTLIIANSNVLHQGFSDEDSYIDFRIILNIEDFSREFGKENYVFRDEILQDGEIQRLFTTMSKEYDEKTIGYKQRCKACILDLLVYLIRNYVVAELSGESGVQRRKNQQRCNSVIMFIENNYMQHITNQQLADLAYLSKDRFEHLFKECVGIPPQQFLNEIRLKKAANLIKKGNMTISEIAIAVGFKDYNHFSRQFRKCYKCTPQEMRKKNYSGIV